MEGMNHDEKANVISTLNSKDIREQLGGLISKITSNQENSNSPINKTNPKSSNQSSTKCR